MHDHGRFIKIEPFNSSSQFIEGFTETKLNILN